MPDGSKPRIRCSTRRGSDFDVSHRSDRIVALLPVRTDPVEQVSVVLNWRSLLQPPNPERRTRNTN
jgi:hypothetical protein